MSEHIFAEILMLWAPHHFGILGGFVAFWAFFIISKIVEQEKRIYLDEE